jgi:hypothetical protein
MFSVERQSLEMAKRELSQFQAKNETISIEVIKFYLNCNILVK